MLRQLPDTWLHSAVARASASLMTCTCQRPGSVMICRERAELFVCKISTLMMMIRLRRLAIAIADTTNLS